MAVEQAVAPPGNAGSEPYDEVVGRMLPLIAAGSYVLTDPRGAITSWGLQAEALFGLTAEEVRGRSVTATLTGSEGESARLVDPEAPTAVSVEIKAKDRDGRKRACELNVIPICLRDGTAFSALVRYVEGAGAAADEAALTRRHAGALAVLGRTLSGAVDPDEDVRLAGVMVIVRPLDEVSWLPEARRGVLAARADRAPSASPAEPSAADAADRLARTAELAERIDRVGRETEEARRDAAEARADAVAATGSLAAVEERIKQLGAAIEERFAGFEARLDELDPVAARVDAVEQQLAAGTMAAQHQEAADSQEAGAALAVAEEARAQAASAVAEMEEARLQAVAAVAEMEEARAQAAAARASADAASAAAAEATARAEEAAGQVLDARRELSEAGDRLVGRTEAGDGASGGPSAGRDPIPDLDDVSAPVALLELDGTFRHLNAAFAALVGYSEEEFRSASWPSVIDRDNRDDHRSLLDQLRSGKREEGLIETFYTGGAGLLVPVAGRISLARDEQGEPEHLRLEL